jgi:hypothetical protein
MGPETFSLTSTEKKKINYVYIYLFSKESNEGEKGYWLIPEQLSDSMVSCMKYNNSGSVGELSIPATEIRSYSVEVRHHYRGWTIIYKDLIRAWIAIALRKHVFISLRQNFYNRNLNLSIERIEFLRKALEMKKYNIRKEEVSIKSLSVHIYGPRIENSHKFPEALNYMRSMLASFEDEIDFKEGTTRLSDYFTIKPRAFRTLSEYEDELKRHKNLRSIFLLQAIAAISLVALTLLGLIFRYC